MNTTRHPWYRVIRGPLAVTVHCVPGRDHVAVARSAIDGYALDKGLFECRACGFRVACTREDGPPDECPCCHVLAVEEVSPFSHERLAADCRAWGIARGWPESAQWRSQEYELRALCDIALVDERSLSVDRHGDGVTARLVGAGAYDSRRAPTLQQALDALADDCERLGFSLTPAPTETEHTR